MITWMTKEEWVANYDRLKEFTSVPLLEEQFQIRMPHTKLEELLNFAAHEGDGTFGDEPGPVMIFCGFSDNIPILITCHDPCVLAGTVLSLPVTPKGPRWPWQDGLEMLTSLDKRIFENCTWVRYDIEEEPTKKKMKNYARYNLHNRGDDKLIIYKTNRMQAALDLRNVLLRLGHQQKLEISVKNID